MLEIEYMVILVFVGLFVLAPYVLWCLRLWFFKKHKLDWYLVNGRWVTWGVLGFIVSVPIVFFSVVALCFSSYDCIYRGKHGSKCGGHDREGTGEKT